MGLSIIRQRIQYYKYYRTDVEVRVTVQSPPTNGGAIAIVPCPFYSLDYVTFPGAARHLTKGQRCQFKDYAVISASNGGSHTFTVPWKAHNPWGHMAYVGVNPNPGPGEGQLVGTVFIYVLAALEMPGAITDPVTISVFARLKNLKLMGYSPLTTLPMPMPFGFAYDHIKKARKQLVHEDKRPPLFEGIPKDGPVGFVTSLFHKESVSVASSFDAAQSRKEEATKRSEKSVVSSISTAVKSVEGIVKTVSDVAKMAESLGPVFGLLDQPDTLQAAQPVYRAQTQMHTHGLSPAQVLSETPGVVAGNLDATVKIDDMNPTFKQIAMKPGYLMRFTVDTSAVKDAIVQAWPVHPLVFPTAVINATTVADPHPLAIVTSGFKGWRGSIKYRLSVYAPAMTTATFRVCWFPDGSTPPASIETLAGDIVSEIFEIKGDSELCFSIPFTWPRLYAETYGTYTDRTGQTAMIGDGTVSTSIATGYVVIYLLAPVHAYDAAATFITCFVEVAAGEDFALAVPVGRLGTVRTSAFPLSSESPEPIEAPKKKVEPRYDKAQIDRVPQEVFKKPFKAFLPASAFVESKITVIDPPSAPHVLARRPVEIYNSGTTNVATLTAAQFSPQWLFLQSAGPFLQVRWIDWILNSFRGYRGSIRQSIYLTENSTSQFNAFYTPEVGMGTISRSYGDPNFAEVDDAAPRLQVSIPWEEFNLFGQASEANRVYGFPDRKPTSDWMYSVRGGAALTIVSVVVRSGVGDDFQLIDWVPPFLTLTT